MIFKDHVLQAQLNTELLSKLRREKEAYKGWKQEQVTSEKYKDTAKAWKGGVKVKAHLELILVM